MDRQIGQVPWASFPVNGQVILDLVSTVLATCRSELFSHGLSSKAARIFHTYRFRVDKTTSR